MTESSFHKLVDLLATHLHVDKVKVEILLLALNQSTKQSSLQQDFAGWEVNPTWAWLTFFISHEHPPEELLQGSSTQLLKASKFAYRQRTTNWRQSLQGRPKRVPDKAATTDLFLPWTVIYQRGQCLVVQSVRTQQTSSVGTKRFQHSMFKLPLIICCASDT
jgi:hypothetical protein